MKIFTLCKKYLLQHKAQLALYVSITLFTTAISILTPFIIGNFLDHLIEGGDLGAILHFSAMFGGLGILRILKKYFQSLIYIRMQTRMSYDFNKDRSCTKSVEHVIII